MAKFIVDMLHQSFLQIFSIHFGKVAILLGKSSNLKMTISTLRIFFKKKSVFGHIGKFLVLKSFMSESFVRFWIRHIFTHAGGHMLDLHKRPSRNVFFISGLFCTVRYDMLHIRRSISRLSHVWQWQIAILGPLEWRNHFGPSNKVV